MSNIRALDRCICTCKPGFLFGQANGKKQKRSQAAKVSRRLALLHAHKLIAKVPRTYRWQGTRRDRRIPTALLAARQVGTEKLIGLAA